MPDNKKQITIEQICPVWFGSTYELDSFEEDSHVYPRPKTERELGEYEE